MAKRTDVVTELAAIAADMASVYALPDVDAFLDHVCAAALALTGAQAVSVALVDEPEFEFDYRAAAGRGADAVRGMRLSLDAGLAGFVASSGQAISVEDVRSDPRFAADVAEELGYVPTRMVLVPINSTDGEVVGVLSVLDRTVDHVGSIGVLDIAAELADLAALGIVLGTRAQDLGRTLLGALADAVEAADEGRPDLAAQLRRRADGDDDEEGSPTAGVASRLAELRALGPGVTAAAENILDELIVYARSTRGRRR